MMELIICGGTVIDGTGGPGRKADILVRNERIVEVGTNLKSTDATVIEATGAYVTPGFIDSHTHFDPSLFWDPLSEMTQHGVTTVLIGNCSLGLAPLRAADKDATSDLFSFIEDIPRDVFSSLVTWSWETYAEYVAVMRRSNYAANVAALVSHSMLRQYVMGGAAWERAASAAEANEIAAELESALRAGAVGMSSSFFDRDTKGRRVPSFYADDAEFDRLFAVLGSARALFQIIPRHPDIPGVCADLERMGEFARRHNVTVLSNAIGDMPSNPNHGPALLACARKLQANGARVYHMLSPRSIELSINPDQSMTFLTMPVWNEAIQADRTQKNVLLNDAAWRQRARHEWDTTTSFLFPTDGLDRIRIIAVGRPDYEEWVGRHLSDVVAARTGHPSDIFADWLLENDINTRFVVPMSNLDPAKVGELARQPEVIISGSDAGAHFQMMCGVGDSTLLLTRHVRDRSDLTLEDAVSKLTSQQADILGLVDRGVVRPGAIADLTIFALDELTWKPEVTVKDVPGGMPRFMRPPGNYRCTIVNGSVVQFRGQDTGARPAEFLGANARAQQSKTSTRSIAKNAITVLGADAL